MATQASLRIPAWLAGPTIALAIGASVRAAQANGLAGIIELAQQLLVLALCGGGLVVLERNEAQLADIYWPSRGFRRLVLLALFVVIDGYLASVFLLRAPS